MKPRLGRDATIGILGGGQLGRMLALAAGRLGLKCHVFSPDPHSPAFDVVQQATHADYADENALDRFSQSVDVITYEFENVPAETAAFLSVRKPVLPDPGVLAITQDRLSEKTFMAERGLPVGAFVAIDPAGGAEGLQLALKGLGRPAVLKTRRFGYDGKGQITIRGADDLLEASRLLAAQSCILEAFVPFEREVSVIAARDAGGKIACFDVTENEHRDHILKSSRAPARVPPDVAQEALSLAERIAHAFDYVGVLGVEMFVLPHGAPQRLLINEIAPRVHNSGHWTLDGASVSQFEQHVRAIVGWPLATPIRHERVEMTNLIGDEIDAFTDWLTVPGASVHLYGKATTRAGRKMGHVTRVFPRAPS